MLSACFATMDPPSEFPTLEENCFPELTFFPSCFVCRAVFFALFCSADARALGDLPGQSRRLFLQGLLMCFRSSALAYFPQLIMCTLLRAAANHTLNLAPSEDIAYDRTVQLSLLFS